MQRNEVVPERVEDAAQAPTPTAAVISIAVAPIIATAHVHRHWSTAAFVAGLVIGSIAGFAVARDQDERPRR